MKKKQSSYFWFEHEKTDVSALPKNHPVLKIVRKLVAKIKKYQNA